MQTQLKTLKINAPAIRRLTNPRQSRSQNWKPQSTSLSRREVRQIVIDQIG